MKASGRSTLVRPRPCGEPAMRGDSDDLVVLTQMAASYRSLAIAAVHELAKATRERDSARAATLALREELRRFTARQVEPGKAA